MNKTIELTPDEALLVAYSLTRRLDTVTDPKVRDRLRKLIAKVQTK